MDRSERFAREANKAFCVNLLREVLKDVRRHFPGVDPKVAWVYHYMRDDWEFHGPDGFYDNFSADNAASARALGWEKWLASKGVEGYAHQDEAHSGPRKDVVTKKGATTVVKVKSSKKSSKKASAEDVAEETASKAEKSEKKAEKKVRKVRESSPESAAKRKRILKLRAKGWSIGKIAKKVELNPTSVLWHLKKAERDGTKAS